MTYSATCRYAIRALCRMAIISPNGFMVLEAICEGTDMPRHYVNKVMQQLVRGGLVKSRRGSHGGYALARSPDDIHLWDVVRLVDDEGATTECCVGLGLCDSTADCPLPEQIRTSRTAVDRTMNSFSLRRLADLYHAKVAMDI